MNTKHLFYLLAFVIFFILSGCNKRREKEKEYIIGFSQCMTDDVWRQAMEIEMNIEASAHENMTILIRDAKENSQLQIKQIKELIEKKVDVLIISPNESDEITPIAEEAYNKGIPTIIVDRKINSEFFTSYVGGDSYEIGEMAGKYVSKLLKPGSTILEVWGTKTTSPAQERHNGFISGLDKSKNFNIVSLEGKWRREIAKNNARQITDFANISLIYAHNDVMALGVRDAILERDSTLLSNIKIIGVDGAFGKDAGLESVADGRIDASFLYPTGGDQVIKVAANIVKGLPVEKRYILKTALIDKPTAETLLMQSNQLINYQKRIEQQRENMRNLLDEFSILKHSLTIILLLLAVVALFSFYILFISQKIKNQNRLLRLKNEETEKQKKQLIRLNEEIEKVTEQKERFFMNVSHEMKTPLTLIINLLEKWIKLTPSSLLLTDLLRMKKNADRLTRFINQLLDFKKIENRKMGFQPTPYDIVTLIDSIKSLFDGLAESKEIHFSFTSDKPSFTLWMDVDKIEKVLMNLLSNAFKFTPNSGSISINLDTNEEDGKITITVTDTGQGINREIIPNIFERFYSDEHNNNAGTGIGLHLTKEFVKLHGGEISVESILNEGTTFRVTIPIRNTDNVQYSKMIGENHQLLTEFPNIDSNKTKEMLSQNYDYTILVVEDDLEIAEFLTTELSHNFKTISANNGTDALEILKKQNQINLVLSDVLMPGMNGFDLCREIKGTPEYSDVPVILLTALSEIDQRIYGIAEGADDYIQKPFQINYVKLKIIRLLKERRQLELKFMRIMQAGGIPVLEESHTILDSDKQFLHLFIDQLDRFYKDSEISVEKISKNIGVSRVHLYRKIKEITGLSPVDYIRNFRLAKAVQLLDQKRFSISEIAYQTGFSSPAYFSKCFRDLFEMTPTAYLDKK